MRILDSQDQVFRCKTVRLIKVMWQHRGGEETTWECEDMCGPPIISYLRTKVRCLIFGIRKLLHMHVFVCGSMCKFRPQNYVKGGRM